MDGAAAGLVYATFSRRLAAGVVDVVLCGLATLVLGGPFAGVAWVVALNSAAAFVAAFLVLLALPAMLYFGLFLASDGRTIGMRAFGIAFVESESGQPPRPLKAWLRGALAVVSGVAASITFVAAPDFDFGGGAGGVLTGVAVAVAALALLGHVGQLRDARRRSVQDRLFGLAVVQAAEKAPAALGSVGS